MIWKTEGKRIQSVGSASACLTKPHYAVLASWHNTTSGFALRIKCEIPVRTCRGIGPKRPLIFVIYPMVFIDWGTWTTEVQQVSAIPVTPPIISGRLKIGPAIFLGALRRRASPSIQMCEVAGYDGNRHSQIRTPSLKAMHHCPN